MDARIDDAIAHSRRGDVVIKCHLPGPRTLAMIDDGTIVNVFTHRDPRDAAASVVRVGGIVDTVEQFTAVLEAHLPSYLGYAAGPTLCIPYDEAVDPGGVGIRRIAERLGCDLEPPQLEALASELGIEQTRARASRLTEDDFEEQFDHERGTLLHRNHVTDGRTGTWRDELTPAQAQAITRAMAPLLDRLGYAP